MVDPFLTRALVVVAIVAGTALVGWWLRRRSGAVHVLAPATERFTPAELAPLAASADGGGTARALLFGSATCGSCGAVERLLSELAAERAGFTWRYVDAVEHLELATAHGVMRLPTLFLIDGDGAVIARSSGVPSRGDLAAVLDRRQDLAAVS